MKKTLLSVLFSLLFLPFAFSQDVITTKTGSELNAKVIEITPSEIKFTTADKADVLQSMPKENIFMIKYANGKKDIFEAQPNSLSEAPALNQTPIVSQSPGFKNAPVTAPASNRIEAENLYIQGRNDASTYYRGYKGAGTGTLISTILFSPAGLITAIATSTTTPSRQNLDYPDANLIAQPDYARGYTQKAKKMKAGKVWTNFGIGLGSLLILSVIVSSGGGQ